MRVETATAGLLLAAILGNVVAGVGIVTGSPPLLLALPALLCAVTGAGLGFVSRGGRDVSLAYGAAIVVVTCIATVAHVLIPFPHGSSAAETDRAFAIAGTTMAFIGVGMLGMLRTHQRPAWLHVSSAVLMVATGAGIQVFVPLTYWVGQYRFGDGEYPLLLGAGIAVVLAAPLAHLACLLSLTHSLWRMRGRSNGR